MMAVPHVACGAPAWKEVQPAHIHCAILDCLRVCGLVSRLVALN